MQPEILCEIDAGRDALAAIDAAIDGDGAAFQFLLSEWLNDPEPLLRHLANVAALLAGQVGKAHGVDARTVIGHARGGIAAAEEVVRGD